MKSATSQDMVRGEIPGQRDVHFRFRKFARRAAICLMLICLPPVLLFVMAGLCAKPPLLEGLSFSRMVLDSNGDILKLGLSKDHKYRLLITLDNINPEVRRAVLHYEDRHFYMHPGVNPFSLARAVVASCFGRARRMGASTITMQVARLRYKLKTASVSGKLRQIWQALLLERHYSKDEILEAYFNLAPYGGNVEGVEAAARVYFNKPARGLTMLESHALAVVPQNPQARNPACGPDFDAARKRLEAGMTKAAQASPAPKLRAKSAAQLPFLARHLAMELLAEAGDEAVRTGIERDLQIMLENSLVSFVSRGRRFGIHNASAILVNWETMRVCAMAGSADFFNAGISGQIDGTKARRSPGSALKPFIYALALEQGLIHPMTMLADSPRSFGGYDPENFDRGFRGPLPAHEALKASRNLPAIALAEQLARPGLYGFLQEAGISLPHGPEHYGLALALGGAEISMRDLATLYAMLANKGLWRPLTLLKSEERPPAKRLLSPEAAWLALHMLEREEEHSDIPAAALYKTGTSNGYRDAWTAGIVGEYVLLVWVGNFDNRANPFFVGAKTALPLFQELVQALGSRRKLAQRPKAPPSDLNLARMRVCASTGDPDAGRCRDTAETWIIPGVSPSRDSGILRPVLVDKASGLRACQPEAGKTEEIWMEFWSTEMLRIFASAGVNKPRPPEWLPQCASETLAGMPPSIILPKKKVVYQRRISDSNFRLPLQASADSEAKIIHWYAGPRYLGASKPGEIFFWRDPVPGRIEILAVDEAGRSAERKCDIQSLP